MFEVAFVQAVKWSDHYAVKAMLPCVDFKLARYVVLAPREYDQGPTNKIPPLILAIRCSDLTMVKLIANSPDFIKSRALYDVDSNDYTILHTAVFYKRPDMLEFFLSHETLKLGHLFGDYRTNEGYTALGLALHMQEHDMALRLINHKDHSFVDYYMRGAMYSLAAILPAYWYNIQSLRLMLTDRHIKIRLGDRNEYGQTVLHLAIKHKKCEAARLLVAAGLSGDAPDLSGETPFQLATKLGIAADVFMIDKSGDDFEMVNKDSSDDEWVKDFEMICI